MEESTFRVEHTWGVAASIYRHCPAQVAIRDGQKLLIIDPPSHRALSKFYSVFVFVGRNPPSAGSNCGSSLSTGFLNNEPSPRFMLGRVRVVCDHSGTLSAPTH